MSRYLMSEPPEAVLSALGDALGLVDFGILLLSSDLHIRFINRWFESIWPIRTDTLPAELTFRDLMASAAATGVYSVPATDLTAYLDEREAQVRAGPIAPTLIQLADRRCILFRCIACPDGGRILTYADITQELQREASDSAARTSAEFRFSAEVLEEQGAYLAELAEAADENAQKADAARLLLEQEVSERRKLEGQLRRLATTDGLTGTLNRTEFFASAQREMDAGAQRTEQRVTVLMIDVDHFKVINDCFGHAGGDRALQQLVATLTDGVRPTDLVGRLGGEEFAIVLLGTSPKSAEVVAERLRARVAAAQVKFSGRLISMTISIGLAVQFATDRSIEQVLARADDALYCAKAGGRNRVMLDQQTEAA